MMRFKGWSSEYRSMTGDELLAERRRLERARGCIFEKDEKLAYISQLLRPRPIESDVFSALPGGVIRIMAGR